jgi:hypothetical protein
VNAVLPPARRDLVESGLLAYLATTNADGSPHAIERIGGTGPKVGAPS